MGEATAAPRERLTAADHDPRAAAISVVVPTRDRPASLRACLAAIGAQDAGSLEVVVVDDGSRDRAAVAEAVATLPGARLVRGAGRGPAAARNLGASAAGGEVVLFCDDDCEPVPEWARLLAAAALDAGVAAGRTVAPAAAGAAVRASQAITNALMDASRRADATLGFAPSCNLAATRATIERVPFDPSYPAAAGEDRDWCARLAAAGGRIAFVPAALAVHRQRLDAAAFLRQQHRYGRGSARYRASGPGRRRAGPRLQAALLAAGLGEGPGVAALVGAAQLAVAAGAAREWLARRAPRARGR